MHDLRQRIRLIALDLDGTLLDDAKRISRYSIEVLQAVAQLGVSISFVTGRMLGSTTGYAREVGLAEPVVVLNGSLVTRPEADPLFCGAIPRSHLEQSLALADDRTALLWFTRDALLTEARWADRLHYMQTWNNGRDERIVERLADHTDQRVYQIHRVGPREALEELERWYSRQPELVCEVFPSQRGPECHMELRLAGTDKGAGLARLCDHRSIPLEQTLAIGDWVNDLSLFAACGHGVAMGNAVGPVKRAADHVLERTNNEDGAAAYLEQLFL